MCASVVPMRYTLVPQWLHTPFVAAMPREVKVASESLTCRLVLHLTQYASIRFTPPVMNRYYMPHQIPLNYRINYTIVRSTRGDISLIIISDHNTHKTSYTMARTIVFHEVCHPPRVSATTNGSNRVQSCLAEITRLGSKSCVQETKMCGYCDGVPYGTTRIR